MKTGKISEAIRERSVRKLLAENVQMKRMNRTDSKANDRLSDEVSVSCVMKAVSFTGRCKDAAGRCVMHAINALDASAVDPDGRQVCLQIILPEETDERELKRMVREANADAVSLGAELTDVHVEVSKAVTRPVFTAFGSGIQSAEAELVDSASKEAEGRDTASKEVESRESASKESVSKETARRKPASGEILVIGWIGAETTELLVKEYYEELRTRFSEDFVQNSRDLEAFSVIGNKAREARTAGAVSLQEVSEGGIFEALWMLGEKLGCGMEVNLRAIPIRQETVEICEFFDINPYESMSGGVLLAVAGNGQEVAERLQRKGIMASVVGRTTEGSERILRNLDQQRYLDKYRQDEIYKKI